MEIKQIVAKTMAGLEPILAEELEILGAKNISVRRRSVYYEGNNELIYKSNFWLRTALNILTPIKKGRVNNKEDLYKLIYKIEWESYFGPDKSIVVHSFSTNKELSHSRYVSQLAKDAIVDRFRKRIGLRPFVEQDDADIYIDVHLVDSICTISFNTSGKPLFYRGYEKQNGEAPVNDLLASAMVSKSGWTADKELFDPFSGSGTILIEAAMKAINMPACFHRSSFSFMNLNDFDRRLWKSIREEGRDLQTPKELKIFGTEIDEPTFKKLESNIRRCRLKQYIKVENVDFFEAKHRQNDGYIITNPPYGERLNQDNVLELYSQLGQNLKFNYDSNNVWILSSSTMGIKKLGFKHRKMGLYYSGKIPVHLINFSIYKGNATEIND